MKEIYAIVQGHLTIVDPELHISYHDEKVIDESFKEKGEFFEHFIVNGSLHGPSVYYFENQKLASSIWYVHGKKMGKSKFFSPDGKLVAVERYIEGRREGNQEYYFPNGDLKTVLSYKNDLLHGTSFMNYENRKPFRTIQMSEGKRHGLDTLWDKEGNIIFSLKYRDGVLEETIVSDSLVSTTK